MSENCLFCTLKNSKNVLLENDYVFVLLDRFPSSDFHFLIIPKLHSEYFYNTQDFILLEVLKMAKKIVQKLNIDSYNLIQNNKFNQKIFHFHLHLVFADQSGNFKEKIKNLTDDEYLKNISKIKNILNN